MVTASHRLRTRMRIVIAATLLTLVLGSLVATWLKKEEATPSPETTTTTMLPVENYVPPRSGYTQRVEISYSLSALASPAPAARGGNAVNGVDRRQPPMFLVTSSTQPSTTVDAPAMLVSSVLDVDSHGISDPSHFPDMRDLTDVLSSFCDSARFTEAAAVCASRTIGSLKNGVILLMAPGTCDDPAVGVLIERYHAAVPEQEAGEPVPTEFVLPSFVVDSVEAHTLRFLFHVLPLLNQNVLFTHPYPVHIMCRGAATPPLVRSLRYTLTNAAYVTVENVAGVLEETISPVTSANARSALETKLLVALKERQAYLDLLADAARAVTKATTTPQPDRSGIDEAEEGDAPAETPADEGVQEALIQAARAWIAEWETRRFWSFQLWFLPSLMNYDVFWRLDAVNSVFTRTLYEDPLSDTMIHGCSFGFLDVQYSTQKYSRGVSSVVGTWNTTLGQLGGSIPDAALRAAWTWLTDGRAAYHGKHHRQDFFIGAFSAFRHALLQSFWMTTEDAAHFSPFKMRWDDGVVQTVVGETTARAEMWNICQFTAVPGYRLA